MKHHLGYRPYLNLENELISRYPNRPNGMDKNRSPRRKRGREYFLKHRIFFQPDIEMGDQKIEAREWIIPPKYVESDMVGVVSYEAIH